MNLDEAAASGLLAAVGNEPEPAPSIGVRALEWIFDAAERLDRRVAIVLFNLCIGDDR